MFAQNKDSVITYQVDSEDKNIFKPFKIVVNEKATVENARGQISSYLNIGFDEFVIRIGENIVNDDSILKNINPSKNPLILHFEEKRYLSEDELKRSIIVVELPIHEKIEEELRKIFNTTEYGIIERIILEKSCEKYYDAVIVFDSILAAERARLYPENILDSEVVIMKGSSIPTTYLVDEKKEESKSVKLIYTGIKAANTVQEYDNSDAFGVIGDYGMKIANKADSAFDIANKTKPLLETTPVKMVSTILSHGMVLDPYLTAKAKLEREEKEKQLEEEKKKEENKIEEKEESIKLNETRYAKRVKIDIEAKYDEKKS